MGSDGRDGTPFTWFWVLLLAVLGIYADGPRPRHRERVEETGQSGAGRPSEARGTEAKAMPSGKAASDWPLRPLLEYFDDGAVDSANCSFRDSLDRSVEVLRGRLNRHKKLKLGRFEAMIATLARPVYSSNSFRFDEVLSKTAK